jgi:2-oxoacid:acceptor oxidoreductase delta subunit (pyruvate/2-ketoisovalerate family)
MKKRYGIKSLEDLPLTSISFITSEGNETGEWRSQRPWMDLEKCTRCGLCWMYCPDSAIRPEEQLFVISYKYCKGCGICAQECPRGAISLEAEER